jgi:hypothetical protein
LVRDRPDAGIGRGYLGHNPSHRRRECDRREHCRGYGLGASGRTVIPAAAQATNLRILRIAVVIYVAAFFGGLIVGMFQ